MAIDLFCYSSLPPDDVKGVLDVMATQHLELFAERFLISWVKDLRDTDDYYDSVARANIRTKQSSRIIRFTGQCVTTIHCEDSVSGQFRPQ